MMCIKKDDMGYPSLHDPLPPSPLPNEQYISALFLPKIFFRPEQAVKADKW
jgi:hypothetical protein